jgi:hypothetical protein
MRRHSIAAVSVCSIVCAGALLSVPAEQASLSSSSTAQRKREFTL